MKKCLLSLISVFLAGGILCNAVEIDGIEYELVGGEAKVKPLERFNQDGERLTYGGNVVIPEKVNYEGKTYVVTTIGEKSFLRCPYLKSVTLPSSIVTLEYLAFYESPIREITLPDGLVTLGEGCLGGTLIQKIHIPESVTTVGEEVFLRCANLSEVNIPKNWTSLPKNCFNQCTSLTELVIPDNIKSIGVFCFYGCSNLKSIKLSNTLEKIDKEAFEKCSALESIELPSSLKILDGGAFQYCYSLKSLVIPNSVTMLGQAMFAECTSLESVTVSESIGSVFPGAFCMSCPALKYVNIPATVTEINNQAFEDCPSLETIDIPELVKGIYSRAFAGSTSLKTISCRNPQPPYIEKNTFGSVDEPNGTYIYENAILYVPSESVNAYASHYRWKAFKNIVGRNFSGIEDVTDDSTDLISIVDRKITIKSDVAPISIYSIDGKIIYTGISLGESIELPYSGVFIVKGGQRILKVFVK